MADAGQVQVRFSVANAEVVRQALAQLSRDGDKALKQFDSSAKAGSNSGGLLASVIGDIRGQMQGLAGNAGYVGSALLRFGGFGFAAAAGLGALYLALSTVSDGSKAFRAYAREVREGADQTRLSIPEFQAMVDLMRQHGVETDKATSSLNKFGVERASAARGQGELYEALRRVNRELAEEFANTRSTGEALNVFAKAMAQADQSTQQLLTRAAFGRGGAGLGPALIDLAGRGGLGAVTEAALKTGAAIDENLIKSQARAAAESERRAAIIERNWNAAYASIFAKWSEFKKAIGMGADNQVKLSINVRWLVEKLLGSSDPIEAARAKVDQIKDELSAMTGGGSSTWRSIITWPGRQLGIGQQYAESRLRQQLAEAQAELNRLTQKKAADEPGTESTGSPAAKPENDQARLARQAKEARERLSALGAAATAADQYRAREAELKSQLADNTITQEVYNRAIAAAALVYRQAMTSARERLGIVTQEELLLTRQAEIDDQFAKGYIKNADEKAASERMMRREVEETTKALEVRRSDFPALTKFAQDARDLRSAVDKGIVSGLDDANRSLVEFQMGTKRADEAWSDFVKNASRGILELLNKMLIFGPMAQSIAGMIGGFQPSFALPGAGTGVMGGVPFPIIGNARGNVFSYGALTPFRLGGVLNRPTIFPMARGAGIAGEDGPEAVMPLGRDSRGRLGVRTSGGDAGTVLVQSDVRVHVENKAGEQVKVRQQRAPSGFDVGLLIEQIDGEMASRYVEGRGALSRAITQTHGLDRKFG